MKKNLKKQQNKQANKKKERRKTTCYYRSTTHPTTHRRQKERTKKKLFCLFICMRLPTTTYFFFFYSSRRRPSFVHCYRVYDDVITFYFTVTSQQYITHTRTPLDSYQNLIDSDSPLDDRVTSPPTRCGCDVIMRRQALMVVNF